MVKAEGEEEDCSISPLTMRLQLLPDHSQNRCLKNALILIDAFSKSGNTFFLELVLIFRQEQQSLYQYVRVFKFRHQICQYCVCMRIPFSSNRDRELNRVGLLIEVNPRPNVICNLYLLVFFFLKKLLLVRY